MTSRKTLVSLAVLLSTVVATGVHAQTRMESATSVFTYEVLGATPSLQLKKRATEPTTTHAAAAPTVRTAEPARSSVLTYDALGATPRIQTTKPAAAASAPAR